jgi:nucleoside-diphosphate-sugar epimerase
LVFGPVPRHLTSLNGLNTSNQRIGDLVTGSFRNKPNPTGPVNIFADVRDVAEAHVRALEVPEAGGQRFFIVGGYFSNKRLADTIRASHPSLATKLPSEDVPDDMPPDGYGWDNSRSRRVLGLRYRGLGECVADTVGSILKIGRNSKDPKHVLAA